MHTDRSITVRDPDPFRLNDGDRWPSHVRGSNRARAPLAEALVVVALVAIEMAAAFAAAAAFVPLPWQFY